MHTLSVDRTCLSRAHGRSVAVEMTVGEGKRLLEGRGHFQSDPDLGHVLRICFGPDDGELLIAEDAFTGELLPGDAAGCDYLIRLE
jgi:hypothetical protein